MEIEHIILTAVVGALTGVGATFLKNAIDYKHEVRSELWNKRFDSYNRVWKLTQLIPLWPKNEKLRYKELENISHEFQKWYFQDGGILLSTPTRKIYGNMQEKITEIWRANVNTPDAAVNEDDYSAVQIVCSSFRDEITNELLSRETKK